MCKTQNQNTQSFSEGRETVLQIAGLMFEAPNPNCVTSGGRQLDEAVVSWTAICRQGVMPGLQKSPHHLFKPKALCPESATFLVFKMKKG